MVKKYLSALLMIVMASASFLNGEDEGGLLFKRYCGTCHGENDKRSGTIVFYSKKTLMSRYKNRSRQLVYKLENINKFSISNIMIQAVHKIEDKKTLLLIVNHLSDPDLPLPGESKGKESRMKDL
jgi:hypothetical protein